jgi:hypothetical protein
MKCGTCSSVFNMKKCTACNSVWCSRCARDGDGPYPKQDISFKCPYCGTHDQITDAEKSAASNTSNNGCAPIIIGAILIPTIITMAAKFTIS